MTKSEKLCGENFTKIKLVRTRRQHLIWKYVADYYCHELKLIIEIDGEIHNTNEHKDYDINRKIT